MNWKGPVVCLACLVGVHGLHVVHECLRGEFCQQVPSKMPDMPEPHFNTTAPSTGQQQVQLDTGSTSTST